MDTIGYIIYGIAVVLAVICLWGIRSYTHQGRGVAMQTVNITLLFFCRSLWWPYLAFLPSTSSGYIRSVSSSACYLLHFPSPFFRCPAASSSGSPVSVWTETGCNATNTELEKGTGRESGGQA